MTVRAYGKSGPLVIVLHGGPAAAGEAAPIARGLADSFRVLEPWQRGSGAAPLSVASHVQDLHELVRARRDGARPAIVGASWGAMLALAYAASHPDSAGPIVLIGCGTFDPLSRARMRETLEARMDDGLRHRLEALEGESPDTASRLGKRMELTRDLYLFDPIAADCEENDAGPFDEGACSETWNDMLRLQDDGVYPAAFSAIESPVLMLHGSHDPHPGQMIRASLAPWLRNLEYVEWERCGHSPWLERQVRTEFFDVLRHWLTRHLAEPG